MKKKSTNSLTILNQLDRSESDDLEFKSAKGGLPKSLWETYSALANTEGGVILLGVEKDGIVSGVDELPKIKKSFWDTINNRGKVNINLLADHDLEEIKHEKGNLLAIRIPRASRYQRPVFLGQNPLTGTYKRNFEGDYRCTEQEVSRMLSDRSEEHADSRILKHFTLKDLDFPTLQQYRQRLSSHKPTHPWLSEDDKTFLFKLGGWRSCRSSGMQGLTVAGLLMFGREEVLREALPQYHVDYREKLSDDPEIRWTDRITMDGTWAGNLFQFYTRVINRIGSDLKLPFQLDNNLFRKGETVVHEAIREAFVNAIIHADYEGIGGIVVEKYKNRFDFSNPGSLLISLDQLLRGNVSECRNKALQTMFTMFGAAEKAGSGVDKIRRGWSTQHWRSPIVREQVQPDRVQWTLPMISLIPEDSINRLKQQFGIKFHKFTKHEVQALVTADIEGIVDNVRMRQITNGHAADMTHLLQGLVSKRVLTQKGQGRWTQYSLPLKSDSVHKGNHSVHKDFDSVHKGNHSVHKKMICFPNEGDMLDDQWEILSQIAEAARNNRRLAPKEMETIILRLCQKTWLTRRQIADLLQRHQDGLRSRFLTSMVEHGLLKLRYPDKPNRTDQAYLAATDKH
ncbi:MAG: hypothetical protein KR126chlam2_00049 [Chlamydiae bacterium]|nr:hypothetical protein [Chlamydiota bacterium]